MPERDMGYKMEKDKEANETYRMGYPWPASALTNKEMGILYKWRGKTRSPISELLRQCVEEMDKIIKGAKYGN